MKSIFDELWHIIAKAAPSICDSLESPSAKIACSILAAIAEANASDPHEIAKKLSEDPDVYRKLAKLEQTHGQWLNELI